MDADETNRDEIRRRAAEAFLQFSAGLTAETEPPAEPWSRMQVRLHRWALAERAVEEPPRLALRLAEEVCAQLSDADTPQHFLNAMAKSMIFSTQLATLSGLDFGTLWGAGARWAKPETDGDSSPFVEMVRALGGVMRAARAPVLSAEEPALAAALVRFLGTLRLFAEDGGVTDPEGAYFHVAAAIVERPRDPARSFS